ncbi:hypothetical protein [Mycobacterium sp. NAZ190054]|uniref:hypothetical protein n=1 Tax=Mycobacterium sp. NAZ190054 TaxID=1747766 RepID=UPI00079413EB|nr:hypothetical protein [Mycobacterium sp. NAZ190054]KWX66776.1 hypothetical protein ASJ79_24125 [Mycobacterium sp. NAZ190054]
MRKHLVLLGIGALMALTTACGSDATTGTSSPSAPFPESARFMADMAAADGRTMTIGISVDGAETAAYACNGIDDEAWFFGTQADGGIDLKSRFRDTLTAEYDGADVTGAVTMNGVEYAFTAAPVSGVAGMYTAESAGVRASWVVRPDGSATGVQFSGFAQGDRNFDPFNLDELSDFDVRNNVRNKRNLTAAGPIEFGPDGAPRASINGVSVTPTLVTGTFRLN